MFGRYAQNVPFVLQVHTGTDDLGRRHVRETQRFAVWPDDRRRRDAADVLVEAKEYCHGARCLTCFRFDLLTNSCFIDYQPPHIPVSDVRKWLVSAALLA